MPNKFAASLQALEQDEAHVATAPSPPPAEQARLLTEVVSKINPAKKNRGIARNFYLSKDVAEAVERAAKKRGVIKSNLVDEVVTRAC